MDKRVEELLKKEFPFVNTLLLEELFMKLETMNVINVFTVSKSKKMLVLNKNNSLINENIMKESI